MVLERELIDNVKPKLSNKYLVFEEVGFLNRSIDMVLLDDSTIITVEFKMRDWRKAISQIEGHLIGADYAYLCMPKKAISNDMMLLLKKHGIGLWQYDYENDELTETVKPRKSALQWELYKTTLHSRLVDRES